MNRELSRRSFLKASGAAGGATLVALSGCAPSTPRGEQAALGETAAPAAFAEDADWRPYRCVINNCAASCIAYGLVRDGRVVRSRTDESEEDSLECPQYRSCLRGMARKNVVYGPDRLKYPMKRKHWQPGGTDFHGELRGKDAWERISWDEALDLTAGEIRRIVDNYTSQAIFRTPYIGHPVNLLTKLGGCWAPYGTGSQGGWAYPVRYMTGYIDVNVFWDWHLGNDRMDLLKSNLIVLWGANPTWSSLGLPNHLYTQLKERGARIISIDPIFHNTAATLADQWIPIRPSTDTAMLLACAYTMIDENLQDQEFLDTYTVGFDAGHMPEGADPTGNFKDYVLGTYDGTPKTPEWAQAICGVDAGTIRDFAREIATTERVAFISGAAPSRTHRGEQYAQAFLTVGWMTGNVGKPGCQVADNYHIMAGNGGNDLVYAGGDGTVNLMGEDLCNQYLVLDPSPSPLEANMGIPMNEQWLAIATGEFADGSRGKKAIDIRMIFDIGPFNTFNQQPGIPTAIEAYRKVEFVVASDSFLTPACQYADIVLPIAMNWERDNEFGYLTGRDALTYSAHMIDPMFEAQTDPWIMNELAKRLGVEGDDVYVDPKVRFYNQVAGAQVATDDGSGMEALFSITEDDLAELGVPDGKTQEGRIPYQQFKREGIYKVRRTEDDALGYIAFKDFIDDPQANPLDTESGKLEICCPRLAQVQADFGSYTIAPIAQYVAPAEGWETTFADMPGGEPGQFPLQLLSVHYIGRMHSTLHNVPVLREAEPQEIFLSRQDAETRGIANGDAVKIYNDRGAVLRQAKVTNRILPGVAAMGEGGWVDFDEELGVDRGGAGNMLTRPEVCGAGIQPYNSVNVQIEKWDGELVPDYERVQVVVELED